MADTVPNCWPLAVLIVMTINKRIRHIQLLMAIIFCMFYFRLEQRAQEQAHTERNQTIRHESREEIGWKETNVTLMGK